MCALYILQHKYDTKDLLQGSVHWPTSVGSSAEQQGFEKSNAKQYKYDANLWFLIQTEIWWKYNIESTNTNILAQICRNTKKKWYEYTVLCSDQP